MMNRNEHHRSTQFDRRGFLSRMACGAAAGVAAGGLLASDRPALAAEGRWKMRLPGNHRPQARSGDYHFYAWLHAPALEQLPAGGAGFPTLA